MMNPHQSSLMTRGLIALCFFLFSSSLWAEEHRAPVKTTSGFILGTQEEGLDVYWGIPYAAAPEGPLRWRPPQPPAKWQDVRSATHPGPICPQTVGFDHGFDIGTMSEDCLSLNIWVPPTTNPDEKLPVMFWIHGGSFRWGAGSWPYYNGAKMAKKGVIVVTLNYRLGYLGRFAHPDLSKMQAGEALANYALMDQVAALQWVRNNIAAFGGDPNKVTIFGNSAGGSAVNYLMVTPSAKALFQGAISQSGAVSVSGSQHISSPVGLYPPLEEEGFALAQFLAAPHASKTIEELRATPFEKIMEYQSKELGNSMEPVVDGVFIPESLGKVFYEGRQHAVPLITGGNQWEESLVINLMSSTPPSVLLAGAKNKETLRALYGGVGDKELAHHYFRDKQFLFSSYFLAAQMHRVEQPAYLYLFNYVPEQLRASQPGSAHGDEVAFVFGNLPGPIWGYDPEGVTENDIQASDAIMNYWVQFAKTGNPNLEGQAHWPSSNAAGITWMGLSDKNGALKEYGEAAMSYYLQEAREDF